MGYWHHTAPQAHIPLSTNAHLFILPRHESIEIGHTQQHVQGAASDSPPPSNFYRAWSVYNPVHQNFVLIDEEHSDTTHIRDTTKISPEHTRKMVQFTTQIIVPLSIGVDLHTAQRTRTSSFLFSKGLWSSLLL